MKRTSTDHAGDINAVLQAAAKMKLRVGWLETSRYLNGEPVAYIAAIQEYGVDAIQENGVAGRSIPARPFMRPAYENNAPKWTRMAAGGFKAAVAGAIDLGDALEQIGGVAAGDIAKAIQAVTSPKIKYKRKNGSTKPLVDTGQMIQSVTYHLTR